jgi:hypothetical protein
MRVDFEKMAQTGQDLTPVIMHQRETVEEMLEMAKDVFLEVERMQVH